jgi:hypothetical protein
VTNPLTAFMKYERTQIALKLISTHIIFIPVLILISLLIKADAFLILSITQAILVILFLTGYWEFFGLRFRIIYSLFIELLLLMALTWKISLKETMINNWYLIIPLVLIQAYLIFELIKIFIVIFKHEKKKVEIVFPFRQGRFLITDGGNSKISRLMNYHFHSAVHKKKKTNFSMMFATDIVQLSASPDKFLPRKNEDYPVFSEKVFSPINGLVVMVKNNIEDNLAYSGNYPYNTGNTIVIQSEDKYLLLGHLKNGSIKVKVGDKVKQYDEIAEAGNSGYSERPHLHFQLIQSSTKNYWQGTGISMEYKGKNLYKNRIIEL